ncbi:MAG: sulfotransferase family protein [Solirubrobacterales bacterium]
MSASGPNGDAEQGGGATKVVFITGMGRSGSTLLELLLGRMDGWVAGGELRRYWHGEAFPDWVCGCGRPLSECVFWARVRSELREGGIPPSDSSRFLDVQRTHLRLRPAPLARLLVGARRAARRRSPLADYQLAMAQLYRAVGRAADARVVVDSSKQPPEGYLASWNPAVDLYAVHLVRDPRAVANSFSKHTENPQPDSVYRFRSHPSATAIRWDIRQALSEALLARRLGDRYMRLRYEDLVSDPAGAVRSIARFAHEPDPEAKFLADGRAEYEPNHTFSGSPFRLRREPIDIRLDESWRARMTPRQKALAAAPALPLMARYGYPLRSG